MVPVAAAACRLFRSRSPYRSQDRARNVHREYRPEAARRDGHTPPDVARLEMVVRARQNFVGAVRLASRVAAFPVRAGRWLAAMRDVGAQGKHGPLSP